MYSSRLWWPIFALVLKAQLLLVPAPCPGASKCASPPAPPPPPPPPPPASPDPTTSTGPPVDCVGQYANSECYGGYYGNFYNISVVGAYGGTPCPSDAVTVKSCSHVPISLNWSYVVPEQEWATSTRLTHAREIPLVVCPLGSSVTFTWSGSMHDVWHLPNEDAYNGCNFTVAGAQKKADASTDSTFEFACSSVGTHYLSCSVGNACDTGNQKVRIYVSDPQKTVGLRAKGAMSLEEFNRKYTLMFAGYHANQQSLLLFNADQAIADAQSVLEHSPASCSDWIPAASNSDQNCRAFVLTDLGYISRVRPNPDFSAAENYYIQALQISPGMCGATAYRAELRVQQNNKAEADSFYVQACAACGEQSMDFSDLQFAYSSRNWATPIDSCVAPTEPPAAAGTMAIPSLLRCMVLAFLIVTVRAIEVC